MLPYTGGKFITFRAYVGDQDKCIDLDVQSVLARHYEEKKTPVRLLDFSKSDCLIQVDNPSRLPNNAQVFLPYLKTYTGNYVCSTADFFKWFFAPEVENAILLDLEQEYRRELGERGEVEAEDRNEKTAKQ